MNYIKRDAQSHEYPMKLIYLQAGILVRFNVVEEQKEDLNIFKYIEFWFDLSLTVEQIADICLGYGYDFNQDYINLMR